MRTMLDLEMIENEQENSLNEIMGVVEKYSLETNDTEMKDLIQDKILFIDRLLQDFEEADPKILGFRSSISSLVRQYFVPADKESNKENFELFNLSCYL